MIPSPGFFESRPQPAHRLHLDLPNALARKPEYLADGRQGHRGGAVETEAAHENRAPLRRELARGLCDERGVLGPQQFVERARGRMVDEHVPPEEQAAGADGLVERNLVALA